MKQSTIFSRILMLGLILMLVLVACEQPTPGQEESEKATQEAVDAGVTEPTAVPVTTAPEEVMQPTAAPDGEVATPVPGEAPAGEVTTPVPGESPAGETSPEVAPTPVSDAVAPTADPNAGGYNPTTVAPVPAGGTYTVSAGENFFRIGLNHGCSVGQMAAVNPHVVPPYYTIYVGQSLTIPSCP